jgi:hypothetical protein
MKIDVLLKSVSDAIGVDTGWSTEAISEWLVGYLAADEEEARRFRRLPDEPHWNARLRDLGDGSGLVLLAVVDGKSVELSCGVGLPMDIRHFLDSDLFARAARAKDVKAEMFKRFRMVGSAVSLSRDELASSGSTDHPRSSLPPAMPKQEVGRGRGKKRPRRGR